MQIFAGGIFPAVPHTYIRTFMTIRKTGRAAALPVIFVYFTPLR